MFSIFSDIAKAAVAVVKLPVSVVADVVTLGGTLTDREDTYTEDNVSDIIKNLENATQPTKK